MIEEALWKILAFIVAVILMFVAPMMTMYDRQEAITYSVVFTAVSELTDITRDVGRLEENNLAKLMDTLAATGNTYDVALEHYRKVYVPVYDSANVFTGEYYSSYEGVYNIDIHEALNHSGLYDMKAGDMFYVQVENNSMTVGQVARKLFWGGGADYPVIVVRNGGMIRHEPH